MTSRAGVTFGGISSSQSSARTPMRRAATLEKTWKMSNRNGRIRSIVSSNTRRMSLALLALIWIESFLALTLTTLQHFRHFFFPSFPKAMRGIPPGRCKLHGPGSTWKASQRLQETETGEQENKAEKTAGNTSETRRAKFRV